MACCTFAMKLQRRQILALLASFISRVISTGCFLMNGVYYDAIREKFDANHVETSLVFSLFRGIAMLTGIVVPFLLKNHSERCLITTGGVLTCVSLTIASVSPWYSLFLLSYALVQGFGQGLILVTLPIAASFVLPEKEIQVANAVLSVGEGTGLLVFPIISGFLVDFYPGMSSLLIMGALFLNQIIVAFGVSLGKTQEKHSNRAPADNVARSKADTTARSAADTAAQFHTDIKPSKSILSVFHNPYYVLFLITSFMETGALQIFWTFAATFYQHSHSVEKVETSILMALAVVGLAGRLAAGCIRRYRWLVLSVQCIIRSLCIFAMAMGPTDLVWPHMIAAGLWGLMDGFYASLFVPMCRDICGMGKLAQAVGFSIFCRGIGAFAGPALGGFFKDHLALAGAPFFLAAGLQLVSGFLQLLQGTAPLVTPRSLSANNLPQRQNSMPTV